MEVEGTDRIIRRSVITHKLRYAELYSNGDSKSFNEVKDVYSVDSVQVVKQECIGQQTL